MRFLLGLGKPKTPEDSPLYGDIYARSVAAGIDIFIIFILLGDFFVLIRNHAFRHVNFELINHLPTEMPVSQVLQAFWASGLIAAFMVNSLVQLVIMIIALTACYVLLGNTPGKWVMGLKIVRTETLEPISAGRFLVRMLSYILAVAPFMIGIFAISFNKKHRGWHDRMMGTVVLNMRGYGWYKAKAIQAWKWLRNRRKESPVE